MATGIVSVAASVQHLPDLSLALLAVACGGWLGLAAVLAPRLRSGRRPRFQSFALVAGTAVVGARVALAGASVLALALWCLAVAFWAALVLRRPVIVEPVGGSLLLVVSVESLAVLAALLGAPQSTPFAVVALVAWLLGLALYPLVLAVVVSCLRRSPAFTPDLWVAMGALAIATLAGTELVRTGRARWPLDVDLATWVAASAAILPLLAAEWRSRAAWRYETSRWSFVFPLGMYSASTWTLARTDALHPLLAISRVAFVVALAAWALTLAGLVRRVSARAAVPRA